ncbi:MAG: PD40 domain-containing protein [Armatimonadota bacterium]|nr:MAG: PD40 domain-containing protein [Armatimonadota bacterium]
MKRFLLCSLAFALLGITALAAPADSKPTLAFLGQRDGRVEVYSWSVGEAAPRQLTDIGASWAADLRWSPDGRRLCVTLNQEGLGLWVIDAANGEATRLTPVEEDALEPRWDADGAILYFSAGSTWPSTAPVWRRQDAPTADDPELQRIYRVPAAGGDITAITGPGRYFDLAPAPGGGVIFGEDLGDGTSRLVHAGRDGTVVRYWEPQAGAWLGAPAPFGEALAAEQLIGWDASLALLSNGDCRTFAHDHLAWFPTWSPDGKGILAETVFNDRRAILWADPGRGTTRLWGRPSGDWNEWNPQWSPDAKLVAYTSDNGGKWRVCVATRSGRDLAASPDNFERGYAGVFRPQGGAR